MNTFKISKTFKILEVFEESWAFLICCTRFWNDYDLPFVGLLNKKSEGYHQTISLSVIGLIRSHYFMAINKKAGG